MTGKEKCKALKEIRRQIAEENGIDLEIKECTYEGECEGTCQQCDSELKILTFKLNKKYGVPQYAPLWIPENGIPIQKERRVRMGKIIPSKKWEDWENWDNPPKKEESDNDKKA